MTLHVATWFHADSVDFRSTYSQMLGDSTSAGHYAVYERCIRVCFGSARRWNSTARLTLVTNVDAESVFAPRTIRLLDALDVERVVVENGHRTPAGYYGRWQNQFFVLDVLRVLLDRSPSGDETVLVLDSDCVITDRLAPDVIAPHGLAGLPMPLAPDEEENGISPRALGTLIDEFPGSTVRGVTPRYLGGELIAGSARVLRGVLAQAEAGFAWSLDRYADGRPVLHEEAHLLSFAVQSLGLAWSEAGFIRRLWTQPWKFRTVHAGDERRAIWHLPAEKKTGLRRLDKAVLDEDGWFWAAGHREWLRRAGGIVSVPRYTPKKLVQDLVMLGVLRVGPAVRRLPVLRPR